MPGPKAPRHWIPLFLAQLAISPDLAKAYRMGCTTAEKVEAMRAFSGYFDVAYRIILREHRRRAREAGLPIPPAPKQPRYSLAAKAERDLGLPSQPKAATEADLYAFMCSNHAKTALVKADMDTLLLLCSRIAAAVGFEELDGLSIIDWFNRQRRVQLEQLILSIGDTDPAHAEFLQHQFAGLRKQAGPNSILQPPED